MSCCTVQLWSKVRKPTQHWQHCIQYLVLTNPLPALRLEGFEAYYDAIPECLERQDRQQADLTLLNTMQLRFRQ